MRQLTRLSVTATLLVVGGWSGACPAQEAAPPLVEEVKVARPPTPKGVFENPVYIPLGPTSYGQVFEKVLDVMAEYFEISYSNRYDGRIESFPRIAPGVEQPWKPGSPSWYERVLATFQTIRHRAFMLIQPADDGGFFVHVTVYRELEDLPRPTHYTAGAAAFRGDNSVERQFEVVDPAVFDSHWIPIGRDHCLEQAIVDKIRKCL